MDPGTGRFAEDFTAPKRSNSGPTWSRVTSLSISPESTIRFRSILMRRLLSKSKPGLGFVRHTAKLFNQRGECVLVTTSTLLVRSRAPEQ